MTGHVTDSKINASWHDFMSQRRLRRLTYDVASKYPFRHPSIRTLAGADQAYAKRICIATLQDEPVTTAAGGVVRRQSAPTSELSWLV